MGSKSIPSLVKLVKESKGQRDTSKINISYSQISQYYNCEHQWYLNYVKKLGKYVPTIHTVFGTALHNTIQTWLTEMFDVSVKSSNNMNLEELLKENLTTTYKEEKIKCGSHFTNSSELEEFYLDGVEILNYLKKKRNIFFSTKKVYLAGVETPLVVEITPGVFFYGLVDLIFYDEDLDKWTILDIKTSTSGWNEYAKKDEIKVSQIILYKRFFSEQFGVDESKIDVKYFIVKRKVPEDPMYPSMAKRVQEFKPPSGKIKQGKVVNMLKDFINNSIAPDKSFIDKEYKKSLTSKSCRFCDFKNTEYCKESINVK